ncbi:MAG: glycosyltransferase family 4 protein [Planctomycetota bacterium]|nr:glycosyltransferase family 4 protein [Planctomycetota bacterium]
MKVLFLTEIPDPRVGSSVRQMYQHARRLRALGHETVCVSTVRDAKDATPTEIEGMRVHRLYSDYNVRWRGWVSLHNRAIDGPLARILAEEQPDVVHAHLVHTHLGYHSLTQAARAGAAVVFTAHDVMTFCYQKLTCFHGGEETGGTGWDVSARLSKCIPCQRLRLRPGRNRRILQVLRRDVDQVTVVSDELGKVLRANDVPVHATVHNAIELGPQFTDERVAAFREKLGLTGKLVLAIGGRLHSQKGVGKLLEMLARLKPDFPELRLIVMGKRDVYDGEFAPQARELGVDGMVVPTGWLDGDELRLAYAACDVFVTPSICFDTFGLVNLEAMEYSKPVVATEFGGSKEVVSDGETGFIANPFDVETYAERIGRLLADPALRQRQGAAGYLRLQQRFTIEQHTDACLGIYAAALASKRDGHASAS